MNKSTYTFLFMLLFYGGIKAQLPGKEAWHWQFGGIAAIDFSTGTPIAGVTPYFNTSNAAASYSDPNTGKLILYSNGISIEDSTYHTIYNGVPLLGNDHSSQGALIVPKPGSKSIYYVFTTDNLFPHYGPPNNGVRYNIVDMSLRNGHGEVIEKNKILTPPPACEKVTAIRSCNGIDFWVITHPYLTNQFYAYKVTSAGLDTVPVVSHTGTVINDTLDRPAPYQYETGYLKASPNGKKLVFAEADSLMFFEIYDFDNSTGQISNPIKIDHVADGHGMYGVAFSPDNKKLYVSTMNYPDPIAIFQYDVSNYTAPAIIASETIIADSLYYDHHGVGEVGGLQLAPDGKIYIARYGIDTLAVINYPNNAGAACGFQLSGFPLTVPNSNPYSFLGLPNLIDAYYAGIQLNIADIEQCVSSSPTTIDAGVGYTSYMWNTGASTQSITINTPGKYWVTVSNQQGCNRTDTTTIITPKLGPLNFVMPNIVTPNNDHINDEIDFSKYQFADLQLNIYNRWGEKVFESNDPNVVWKPSDTDGTYLYTLSYKIYCVTDLQTKNLKGFITVIR